MCTYPISYLVAVTCVSVAEPLDVVEDEPGQGDDHQDDEGDGDEHHRRAAHVLLEVPGADANRHGYRNVALQQSHDLATLGLRDHYGDHLACTWREATHTHTHTHTHTSVSSS